MLPKETKDRIWKDGINFSEDAKQRISYMNGAKTEAERSQKLVEALDFIARIAPEDSAIKKMATFHLNEYSNPKN